VSLNGRLWFGLRPVPDGADFSRPRLHWWEISQSTMIEVRSARVPWLSSVDSWWENWG